MTRVSTPLSLLCSALVWMTAPIEAPSATMRVPSEHPTIQAAIDSATHGDEIVVATGTYYETIHFQGKNIRLASTDPNDWAVVESTVIDAIQTGSVVTFSGSETESCELTGFTITNGYANKGGGISGNGTHATVSRNRIVGNRAYGFSMQQVTFKGCGGGVHGCNGTLRENRILDNRVYGYGGGVAESNGSIIGNVIEGNESEAFVSQPPVSGAPPPIPSGEGGGLYACNGLIANNEIVSNTAEEGRGGGMVVCDAMILNNRFVANTASAGGACHGCNGDFISNQFLGNRAKAYKVNTIITSTSGGLGGALANCTGRFEQNLFIENRAIGKFYIHYNNIIPVGIPVSGGAYGGAVFYCQGNLVNNLLIENEAIRPVGGYPMETIGGAIHNFNGLMANNTLVGNRAPDRGGAVSNSSGTIQNCIFWLNSASEEAQVHNSSLPDHSLIQGWTGGGIGNIDLDPSFVDLENGDFHLRHDSPCIDSGVLIPSVTDDYDGNPRPFMWSTQHGGDGSGYDMGAYEFYPGPDVNYDHSIDGLDLFVFQQDWRSISGPSGGGALQMGTDLSTSLSVWNVVTGPGSYTPSGYATDLDADGKVDVYDLLNLLNLMK